MEAVQDPSWGEDSITFPTSPDDKASEVKIYMGASQKRPPEDMEVFFQGRHVSDEATFAGLGYQEGQKFVVKLTATAADKPVSMAETSSPSEPKPITVSMLFKDNKERQYENFYSGDTVEDVITVVARDLYRPKDFLGLYDGDAELDPRKTLLEIGYKEGQMLTVRYKYHFKTLMPPPESGLMALPAMGGQP